MLDQRVKVLGGDRTGVVLVSDVGVTKTAKVDSVDTVPGGEQRNELAEGPPRLRESVDQEHRDDLVSCGDVVQLRAVYCRNFVPGTGDGCLAGIHERLLNSAGDL